MFGTETSGMRSTGNLAVSPIGPLNTIDEMTTVNI